MKQLNMLVSLVCIIVVAKTCGVGGVLIFCAGLGLSSAINRRFPIPPVYPS